MTTWPLQKDADSFYGNPRGGASYSTQWARERLVHVACPWPLRMGDIHIPAITVNAACSHSLSNVLAEIWDEAGKDENKIRELRYDVFSGSFVFRKSRTGNFLSMHGYGAAIDFDAPDNMLHSHKHLFTEDSIIVRAFKKEGWIWGGDWSGDGVDAMHFQAARIHT
jgi:D-alanyl-D-alanine carboxypeptidase